jgi:hypothetical protein
MNKGVIAGVVVAIVSMAIIGYFLLNTEDSSTVQSPNSQLSGDSVPSEGTNPESANIPPETKGPGGCTSENCNEYCSDNTEECEEWCSNNPDICQQLMSAWGSDFDQYEDQPSEKDQPEGPNGRQGDGVWDKDELTFYIKDEEGVLTESKKNIIRNAITSTKKSNGGYWGWNSALEELNNQYPNNIVPNNLIEIENKEADIIIALHSAVDYCCDYNGERITGEERSTIGENDAKILSEINIYNIINIDSGFLGDVTRHELGHTIGLFVHVTDRNNDLMSRISPASEIKDGNLKDLYEKYRDRKIDSNEQAEKIDKEYY